MICLSEPGLAMDTYIGFGSEAADWVAGRPGAVLMLLASVPSVFLLRGGRLLKYGGLAIIAGAVTSILLGLDSIAAAIVVTIANIILVSARLPSIQRELTLVEERLESALSSMHDLETAEQRRQTYGALHPREPGNTSVLSADSSKNGTNRASRGRRKDL